MQAESSTSATDQADPVTGDQEDRASVAALLNDAQILWKEHAEQLKGVGDLALLEFELSTQSVVRLVLVTLVIAGLVLSTWGLLLGAATSALVARGVPLSLTLLIGAGFTVLASIILVIYARSLTRNIGFRRVREFLAAGKYE